MSSDDFICSWCKNISTYCSGNFVACECESVFCSEECAEQAGFKKQDGNRSCCLCEWENK